MTFQAQPWENRLLSLAYEAIDSHSTEPAASGDQAQLSRAYQVCANITRTHSRTFYMASALFPPEKRAAARALYAFSRISDDIVDRASGEVLGELYRWRTFALYSLPRDTDYVPLAWAHARKKFKIPLSYSEQLINGIARDVEQKRYDSFSDLTVYCYGVACTVGLMSMHITGYQGPEAIPYAIRLGVALQLTNILRDVADDWQAGRLYLPLDEMQAFGVSEEDIARGHVTKSWQAFMQFQLERVRQIYASALPGVRLLDADGRFAIAAAGELYKGILDHIEAARYDVFSQRAHMTTSQKFIRLPGIWYRSRTSRY